VNVYVESNFVLELALLQEQCSACEDILSLCESREVTLVLPAYSLMEPYGTLMRRHAERKRLKASVDGELRQITRTTAYANRIQDLEAAARLLLDSTEEDMDRLERTRSRLLGCAEMVPLDSRILTRAPEYQARYSFSALDAVVYASVLTHLENSAPPASCFLNRDAGFSSPEIVGALETRNCKFLPGFDHGLQYLRWSTSEETPP
jgi:predicted nucleic acid-binding protein